MSRATATTAELLAAFVEAALHQLLCVRGVYPPQLFHRRRRFGQLVWQSHSTSLTGYLREVCVSIIEPLQHGLLRCLVLLVLGETGELAERFVFQFRRQSSAGPHLFPRCWRTVGHNLTGDVEDFLGVNHAGDNARTTRAGPGPSRAAGESHLLVSRFPDILARLEIVGCWLDGLGEPNKDNDTAPEAEPGEEVAARLLSARKKDPSSFQSKRLKLGLSSL